MLLLKFIHGLLLLFHFFSLLYHIFEFVDFGVSIFQDLVNLVFICVSQGRQIVLMIFVFAIEVINNLQFQMCQRTLQIQRVVEIGYTLVN